jgi:hypothetical protein
MEALCILFQNIPKKDFMDLKNLSPSIARIECNGLLDNSLHESPHSTPTIVLFISTSPLHPPPNP